MIARMPDLPAGAHLPPPVTDSIETQLAERLIDSRIVHQGRYLEVRLETTERADGSRHERDVVRHPGAVAIVALDDADRLLLVRQWRQPAGRSLLEIPAGTLDRDPGTGAIEDPEIASRRELEEETGYRADRWEKLGTFWTAPGFASELMHLYVATGLVAAGHGRLTPDADEALELVRLPLADALAAAVRGDIHDAKTLIGILLIGRPRGG